MSYQNDPLGTIESDLADVEKELEVMTDLVRAAEVLNATDRTWIERSQLSVQEAALMVAKADLKHLIGADFKTITLPEIINGLKDCVDGLTEERDSFVNAYNELLAHNRGLTVMWIHDQIKHAEAELKRAEADHVYSRQDVAETKIETLKACLDQLGNVKAKYVD